jgi:hypothetical protein
MRVARERLVGVSLIAAYVFCWVLFAWMQAHSLVFKKDAFLAIASILCGGSLLGLLIWDRQCGRANPSLAFVVRIIVVVSVLGFLFSLTMPVIR